MALDEVRFYIQAYANGITYHSQPNNVALKRVLEMKSSPFYLGIWLLRIQIFMLHHSIIKLSLLTILILFMCMIIPLSKSFTNFI